MARKHRFNLIDIPQYVMLRGNNRSEVFFTSSDYSCYLESLGRASQQSETILHAYALTPNEVHLLVTPRTENSIPGMMQSLGRRYAHFINRSYSRSGTLWDGRYKACLVDPGAYLLATYRYIEARPKQCLLVKGAEDYIWSSHQHNALGKSFSIITPHEQYQQLGATKRERLHNYRKLFLSPLAPALLHKIEQCLQNELVLGTERFKDRIARITDRPVRHGKIGRPRLAEGAHISVY